VTVTLALSLRLPALPCNRIQRNARFVTGGFTCISGFSFLDRCRLAGTLHTAVADLAEAACRLFVEMAIKIAI